jgi:CheY-like chemotaxis protein
MSAPAQHHILAVNNDDAVLQLFTDLLSEEGYKVSTEKYLNKNLTQVIALVPDCIILDYMWADEDGGWSFLQMLRMEPKTANIPIILCTGAVREVQELEGQLKEMKVQVVLKPFDIDELLGLIRTALPDVEMAEASD